ncbi:MFS transporter [Candidatus Pantoea deserta]|uniref:MFS transporter n=1 Tax=Candidatus Pantoea deserta TaxID=1869313 RepID=UPI001F48691D|nr:MFS transporter [Pantoea deserta]
MNASASRHAFHYVPFRNLFFARTLTVLGNSVAPVALAFAVLDMGGSAADLGIVVAARSLFNVVFLLFGGVLADRYSRNRVLLLSSAVAALSQSGVAWLVLDGSATLNALALLSAVNGAAAGIALPASSALVPQTVPAQKLRQANAFIQSGVYAGTIVGASLGGILTSAVGAGWGLAVDALGFAIAAPLYFSVRTGVQLAGSQTTLWQDLRDGWREFTSRSWVWAVVAQFAVVNAAFTGMVMVLGPVIADDSFGRARWGMMIAAQSVGLILGSWMALRWRPRRAMLAGVMLVALCVLPILLLAEGAPAVWLMIAFCVAGIGFGQFGVVWAQALQTHIPRDRLARVYAYDAMGSFITIPLGELAAGPLAMQFGSSAVLVTCAAAVLAATGAACLVPSIRGLTQRE